jgi:hypothetical protein
MIKLGRIVEEVQEKRKFMKAALEIATGLSRRGYDPKEAVEQATRSVMHTMGYEFSDKEKQSLEKVIPVHANFK